MKPLKLRQRTRLPRTFTPALQITAPCSRQYHAHGTSGTRALRDIRWVVLHSTEGATAEAAARWFENPDSKGSAHLCIDDGHCYRTLDNADIPWAAPGANKAGFHVEQAGFARWDVTAWLRHRQTVKRAAYKTALHCELFGLPPVFRFAADLKLGRPGVTTHAQCTKAFGGDHTDPGLFWPRRLFMRYVREYHAGLNL